VSSFSTVCVPSVILWYNSISSQKDQPPNVKNGGNGKKIATGLFKKISKRARYLKRSVFFFLTRSRKKRGIFCS
jgi:hypothetical protein